MVTVIFGLQCAQAVYQAVRDVRYVRLVVALVRWLILWLPCGLCRLCQCCGLCGSCTACGPEAFYKSSMWVYTPSMAWETDRNAANTGFQLSQLTDVTPNLGQQPTGKLALKAYEDGNVTYYVDEENEKRLRFYLGVRKLGTHRSTFMLNIRKFWPGCYIGSHKSSGTDYYEECMSGCAFRAVKCRLVVDPEPPMPNFSILLAIVSVVSLIAGTKGMTAVIILAVVLALDVLRSLLVQPWFMKFSTCLEFWLKSIISKWCKCSCTPYFIVLLESMNESMKNASWQYTNSYAPLDKFALLGNGSRVACDHKVLTNYQTVSSDSSEATSCKINFTVATSCKIDVTVGETSQTATHKKSLPQGFGSHHYSTSIQTTPHTHSASIDINLHDLALGDQIEQKGREVEAQDTEALTSSALNEIQPVTVDGPPDSTLASTESCESVVIKFDRAAIKIERSKSQPRSPQTINLEWLTITKGKDDIREIHMNGKDKYNENDWRIVKERMRFAAEHKLFPVWSMDERQAHCKEIKYDFFNGRYHKGCVITFDSPTTTRVVGGDFQLDTEKEFQPLCQLLQTLRNVFRLFPWINPPRPATPN